MIDSALAPTDATYASVRGGFCSSGPTTKTAIQFAYSFLPVIQNYSNLLFP